MVFWIVYKPGVENNVRSTFLLSKMCFRIALSAHKQVGDFVVILLWFLFLFYFYFCLDFVYLDFFGVGARIFMDLGNNLRENYIEKRFNVHRWLD